MGSTPEMTELVLQARSFEQRHAATATFPAAPLPTVAAFAKRTGFSPEKQGTQVILREQVACELGHPTTQSVCTVLTTTDPGLVRSGALCLVGPDLAEIPMGTKVPFGQVITLLIREGGSADPFDLETTQYLIDRLPGYMVRSLPGRLWARVSKEARHAGFSLVTLAQALMLVYASRFSSVLASEVLLVTASDDIVSELAPLAMAADVLRGTHKKVTLGAADIECAEQSCETCVEKPVCDSARELLKQGSNRT